MNGTSRINLKNNKFKLMLYDMAVMVIVYAVLLLLYKRLENISLMGTFLQALLTTFCVLTARYFGNIYNQIWRYGGIQCYIRLLMTDGFAFCVNYILQKILPIPHIISAKLLAIACMNLLGALTIRMVYRYAYKCADKSTLRGRMLSWLLQIFAGETWEKEVSEDLKKIKIAIIGAGRIGVSLAEDLLNNPNSCYIPRCFVDVNREKAGREIHGIPVMLENEANLYALKDLEIQEVVFAISSLEEDRKRKLYEYYKGYGFRIKVYDYPEIQTPGSKMQLREFDIEDLLFRKPIVVHDEKTSSYYKDKSILITGGGGSIGSELCRQLAKMQPRQLIILDICENGVYDVQQELRMVYEDRIDLQIEITSVCSMNGLKRVFEEYHPQIVIHAAAHKHVPLMEKNCIEAVENNVFGTRNVVECCEQYGTERFMMVSTDKAVNPTNVMGATKRMCEMIVQSASTWGKTKYSATRFGNVLGSAGSVIPLFKKQIAAGGPVTLTDRRIIRYFMTIPEASQLVLQSGAMAANGELFVLDMGKPIRILDLAENMIHLSGAHGIEIQETGLRPGEKLYEELLVKTEELDKTENSLIFIERDTPHTKEEIEEKLQLLQNACRTGDDEHMRETLRIVVPTYKRPETVNRTAYESMEMKMVTE